MILVTLDSLSSHFCPKHFLLVKASFRLTCLFSKVIFRSSRKTPFKTRFETTCQGYFQPLRLFLALSHLIILVLRGLCMDVWITTLRVVKTAFFGEWCRCFCPLPKTAGFDEWWRNWRFTFHPQKQGALLLRPRNPTKNDEDQAGVTPLIFHSLVFWFSLVFCNQRDSLVFQLFSAVFLCFF